MARTLWLFCLFAPLAAGAGAQAPAPSASAHFLVVYVEVIPSLRAAAVTALKRYREEIATADGEIVSEIFEQVGRRGHFVMIEAWRDQNAFFAGSAQPRARLLETLKPLRLSGWDERPYKALDVGTVGALRERDATVVVGHVDVSPDPKVPQLLRGLAEASRRESGNLRFDVLQHTTRANHFTVVEAWRDAAAQAAHAAAAHTRQYREDVQPMTGSPLDNRLFAIVD